MPNRETPAHVVFPTPSMRVTTRRGTDGDLNMEDLIKKTMEDEEEGGIVEKLAKRIARGRKPTGRPSALK